MFEQFGNYHKIIWIAKSAARFFHGGDKFQVAPDLDNFKLLDFQDLRKLSNVSGKHYFQLKLIGSSKTHVYIEGPDTMIDEMISRLPYYKDKSWRGILNMSLERDFINCKNAHSVVCDPRVIDATELKPLIVGKEVPELDLNKTDDICVRCKNFEFGKE